MLGEEKSQRIFKQRTQSVFPWVNDQRASGHDLSSPYRICDHPLHWRASAARTSQFRSHIIGWANNILENII